MIAFLHKFSSYGVLLLLLGMAACAPTGKQSIAAGEGQSTAIGGVVIQPPEGPPGPMASLLAQSVAAALVRRGYAARAGEAGATRRVRADFLVSGTAEALEAYHAPTVAALHWVLYDNVGKEIAYLTQGVRGSVDSWTYGSPAMLRVIGEEAAADFSVFLGQPHITPAEVELPGVPTASTVAETENLAQMNADGAVKTATTPVGGNKVQPLPAPPAPPPLPITSELKNMRDFGVWLDEVTGAPGNGNPALTQAIFADLKRIKLPFAMTPGLASHYIQGVVDVAVRSASQEHVTIVWVVSNSRGEEIGRVSQRNDIVRGSLHGKWGDTAVYAARGGVEGIIAILERDLDTVLPK